MNEQQPIFLPLYAQMREELDITEAFEATKEISDRVIPRVKEPILLPMGKIIYLHDWKK